MLDSIHALTVKAISYLTAAASSQASEGAHSTDSLVLSESIDRSPSRVCRRVARTPGVVDRRQSPLAQRRGRGPPSAGQNSPPIGPVQGTQLADDGASRGVLTRQCVKPSKAAQQVDGRRRWRMRVHPPHERNERGADQAAHRRPRPGVRPQFVPHHRRTLCHCIVSSSSSPISLTPLVRTARSQVGGPGVTFHGPADLPTHFHN